MHRNQATDKGGSNPSQRVCGWGGGVETDWTGGGAFKRVERSPSCRARRASDPQREGGGGGGRRALSGLEQPDLAASTRLLLPPTGVGEVVAPHEPALGVRRDHYPESYLPRRCRALRVKKEERGTNLDLRSPPPPTIKALYLRPEGPAPSLACRILNQSRAAFSEEEGSHHVVWCGFRWVRRSR